MARQTEFTDEQLTAYLDGEFEFCPKQDIEAALANDPTVANRMAALDIDKAAVADAMNRLMQTAPQIPDLNGVSEQKPKMVQAVQTPRNTRLIAASVGGLMLAIGVSSGFLLGQNQDDDWQAYVAYYQRLYVEDTLQFVSFDQNVAQQEIDRINSTVGYEFSLDVLRNVDGLDYKRAQVLGFEGKPLAQMTFLTKTGVPIAFCVLKRGSTSSSDIRSYDLKELATAYWASGEHEFMVIGGADQNLVEQIAKNLKSNI